MPSFLKQGKQNDFSPSKMKWPVQETYAEPGN